MSAYTDSQGRSLNPSSYKIISIDIENHSGSVRNIKELVSDFTIRESLYLPSLILEITIADTINFFEAFRLIGQEKIRIELEKYPIISQEPIELSLEFYVSEYPSYTRPESNQTQQVYKIRGISSYAYNSKFQKISRNYSGSASEQVVKILKNDLFFSQIKISGTDATTSRGILNYQEPLKAIEFFRKSAYDGMGSPFFFYQTLDGTANFASLSHLMSLGTNPSYNTYYFLKGYTAEPFTEYDYIERANRILSCTSDLSLSKPHQAIQGAFASNNRSLDISSKTYTNKKYDYLAEDTAYIRQNSTNEATKILLSDAFKIGRDNSNTINTLPDAHDEYISINRQAYSDVKNYNGDLATQIHSINAYNALFDTLTHEIELNGDFNLNSGKSIRLIFPKSMEADTYRDYNEDDFTPEHVDTIISGDYLITSVIHKFGNSDKGAEYYTSLKLKKDSVISQL